MIKLFMIKIWKGKRGLKDEKKEIYIKKKGEISYVIVVRIKRKESSFLLNNWVVNLTAQSVKSSVFQGCVLFNWY